jgi:ATP-binding cassette subfamily B (MDR/TAP) protein 1
MNYRTVASLATDSSLVKTYDDYIAIPSKAAKKKAHLIAFMFGFSQFTQNAVSALLFYSGAQFVFHFPESNNGEDIFKAIFCMMFGSFAAGQATQFGPDMGAAKKSAIKIFTYIDQESKINAIDIPTDAVAIDRETFRGKIEFRDVWFRYPSRKNEWVFKGLNLVINPNESVACVGESGSGKSTLVNLILRFYDPDFGTVLIDDVDVKDYNLKELRKRMGLVMQEPTLFNYTIKENILYGEDRAYDSDIQNAASVANALEFIESSQLHLSYEDSAVVLSKALNDNKKLILEHIT